MSKLIDNRFFWPVAICIAILVVYLPSLQAELVFDDERLMDGSIFASYGGFSELKQRLISYGSFVWVRDLLGDGWWKQRLVNVAIHMATAIMLYHLIRALLNQTRLPELPDGIAIETRSVDAAAGLGVLLFALNPVSVYAVAYLVQRSILMATFFSVACLYLTLKSAQHRQMALLTPAVLAYALAVLSKEYAVMLPLVAVALYLIVRRPGKMGVLVSVIGTLVVVGGGAYFLLQRYEGAGMLGQVFDVHGKRYVAQLAALSPGFEVNAYSLSILNQTWLFIKYGVMWFIPNVLWMSLDLRPAFPLSFSSFPHILGLPIYLGSLSGAIFLMWRFSDWRRLVGFALLVPGILFATEFATVWIQDPFVLYRSYLWAAVSFPLVTGIFFVTWPIRKILIASIALSLAFASLAVERVFSMKSETAAWQDAAAKIDLNAPPSAVGRWRAMMNRGNQYFQNGLFSPALADYQMASHLGAPTALAEYHRGTVLQQMGRLTEALEAFEIAERNPGDDQNPSLLPMQKGSLLFQMGRFPEAIQSIDVALPLITDTDFKQSSLTTRAKSNIKLARYGAAVEDYRKVLAIAPENRTANIELAIALGLDKKPAEAILIADKWLGVKDGADVRFARAMILARAGKPTEALAEARLALQFKPGDPLLQGLVQKLQTGS